MVPAHATPLILDWSSHQRAELEAAMTEGVVAVKYDCNTIELVQGCALEGNYGFLGVQKKEDSLQLSDADEIRANLPTFGAKLSAELVRGSALDLAFVTVGKRRTLAKSLTRQDFSGGACKSATHFVRGAYVGAFAMREGKAGHVAAAAEVFGYGASGKSSKQSVRSVTDGERSSCDAAAPDQTQAPARCASLLRLELVAIGAETKTQDLEVSTCPEGLALVNGKCTSGAGKTFQCDPGKPQECRTQCEKGDAASCGFYAYAMEYGWYGTPKEPEKARPLYEQACSKGVLFACAGLGQAHAKGIGGPKNYVRANELWKKACDGGNPRGCNNLAVSYEYGHEVAKDIEKAVRLFERACAGGMTHACGNLGAKYLYGYGTKRDPVRGKALIEQSCTADDPGGCKRLGELYLHGQEVPQDPGKANILFRRACEAVRTPEANEACRQLGWSYVLGRGVGKDVQEGVRRIRTACDDSHGPACTDLGAFYFSGEHLPKDELKGNALLEGACQRGVGDACSQLGYSFEKGRGVAQDRARSQQLYAQACKAESGVGCYNLAVTSGRSTAEVLPLFRQACSLGWADGCYEHAARAGSTEGERVQAMQDACAKSSSAACAWLGGSHPAADRRVSFLERACDLGRAESCWRAGQAHQQGTGGKSSHLKAADFYDRACKAKYGGGCTALAALYESSPDLPKDSARAEALRKQRCFIEAGDIAFWNCRPEWVDELCKDSQEKCAQYAYKLAKGSHNQKADPKLAASVWKKGCEAKHFNSCWGLAEAHEHGWGTAKNDQAKRKYFKLACDYGADPNLCKVKLGK